MGRVLSVLAVALMVVGCGGEHEAVTYAEEGYCEFAEYHNRFVRDIGGPAIAHNTDPHGDELASAAEDFAEYAEIARVGAEHTLHDREWEGIAEEAELAREEHEAVRQELLEDGGRRLSDLSDARIEGVYDELPPADDEAAGQFYDQMMEIEGYLQRRCDTHLESMW